MFLLESLLRNRWSVDACWADEEFMDEHVGWAPFIIYEEFLNTGSAELETLKHTNKLILRVHLLFIYCVSTWLG